MTLTSNQAVGNLESSMFGSNFQTKLFPEGKYKDILCIILIK